MNKQFICRFTAGFTGALVLASIYVLMNIALCYVPALLPHSNPVLQKLLLIDQWTFDSIKRAFIVALVLGFILGCSFPQKIRKWFPPTALGIPVTILLIGCFMYNYAGGVAAAYGMKLADCTNSTTKVHFTVPVGRKYYLAFEPIGASNTPAYKLPGPGHIRISQGDNTITNLPVTDVMFCRFFREKSNYDLEITFDQTPLPSTSIWLHWVQSYKDRDR